MFKIKEVHKLKLQTPETTKFVCSTKKSIDKIKNDDFSGFSTIAV